MNLEALSQTVAAAERVEIRGAGTKSTWAASPSPAHEASPTLPRFAREGVEVRLSSGIIDFSPNDQVVSVHAGTLISDLQRELGEHGQCLPLFEGFGTVGGSLSINLPHLLESLCGSWRDWTLGMTLVLADGAVAKSGSQAVKNVAGYDIHKLMIGARGTLAVIAEVILRTYPIKSLPEVGADRVELARRMASGQESVWVQRVKRTDFDEAAGTTRAFGGFEVSDTSTIWRTLPAGTELQRFPGDWVMRTGTIQIEDPTVIHYMKRTKEILDPTGKLNPGAMGVF